VNRGAARGRVHRAPVPGPVTGRTPGALARFGPPALVAVVLVLVTIVRVRFAATPLERDEGEYAYAGQLILQGVPPYDLAYNMKFPGAYYAYALIMAVFGQSAAGIRLGLLVVNLATTLLVYGIARRLYGRLAAAVAAVAFSLLTLDRWVMGVFAHATHFVLLPALAGLYLLLAAPAQRRAASILTGGALLGLAVLVKQHAFTFLPLGALVVALGHDGRRTPARLRDVGLLVAGAIVPCALLGVLFLAQGVLGRFWSWTIDYARAYVSEVPLASFLPNFGRGFTTITRATGALWVVAGAGLVALWLGRWPRQAKWFLTLLLAAAFIAVCPGLYFREHYFILLLPAVAMLDGIACAGAARLLARGIGGAGARRLATAAFLVVAAVVAAGQRDFLFHMSPQGLSRSRYGRNPFLESVAIADTLRARTVPGDRIAVLGSEPEIYFYSRRRSATGYIYMYPLVEPQPFAARMQDEMMRQVEGAHPKYLVLVQVTTSWLPRTPAIRRIVEWANAYTGRCYDLVGVTDIVSLDETRSVWDADVAGYRPQSPNLIYVFRRKGDSPCTP